MRKINVKLFLGLLIGTLVVTGAVFAVHFFQSPRIAQSLLWQAQRAEEQGDLERTARYLERYLEFKPRDQKERARLGSLLAGEQFAALPRRRLKGVNLLDDVLTAEPGRDDLRLLVVKTCLDLRNRQLARSHLDKLWANASNPGAATPPEKLAELELLWGRLLEGENKPEEAIAKYRDAVRHAKGEPDASLRLAFLLRGLADKDALKGDANREEADRVMDQLVEAKPGSYKSYLFRWRYRRDFNLLALGNKSEKGKVPLVKAADDVAAAFGREREKVEVLLAKADLERLLANSAAEDPDLENRGAEADKHRKFAREVLEEGLRLQEKPGYPDVSDAALFQLLWHVAHLQFDEYPADPKATDAARAAALKAIEGTVERVAKTRAIPATVDYLRGRLLLVKGQWAGAADLLEKARPALAPQRELAAQIDLFLGQCYERLENAAQMYEAYKRVNDWDPAGVSAYLGMGAALWMMGRLDEAADNFRLALKAERVPAQAWLDFARLEIQRQRLKEKPDWGGALDALGRAEKLDGKSADVILARAQLHLVRDEADKAEALLVKAANEQPQEPQFWAALVALADRKDAAKAAQYLNQGQSKAGDKVLLRLARAGLLAKGQDGKAAREQINQLLQGIEKMGPEDQAQLLNGLGAAQYQAGNVEEARRLWTKMCDLPRYRNDMRVRLLLFDLALQQGEGVQQALDDIRELEKGHGAFHRYGNALRLTWEAKKGTKDRKQALDEARQELDFARRQQPRWPAPCLALAEIDDLTGNPEGAIKNLRDAIDLGETSPVVVKRLVNALYRQNRVAEANQEIKKLQRLSNQGDDLLNLVALSYIQEKNPSQAVKTIEAAKLLNSNDYKEYLSRGLIYDMAGKRTEAEQNLRKAVTLAEKEPAPWIGLVRFLAAHGGDAVARTEMEKARKSLPPEKVNLTLAQCYEALGLNKDALKYYRLALEERRSDTATVREVAGFLLRNGQLEEAKPLLWSIKEGRTQAGEADREWARRGLAIVLSSGTDYRDFRAALELVGVKLDDNGLLARPEKGGDRSDNTESQRARARVLATQPQRQFRERAIELLEDLRARGALTPDDQFVLALLLEAQGAKEKSFNQIEALVKSQADQPQYLSQGLTPQYLAKYVQILLRQNQLDVAARWIDEIEKLERQREVQPNDYLSVELRARLLEARNQGDKAITLLRAHAERRNARPEDILLVVASLGRQRKFAAALDVCEAAWRTKCPPEYLGGACVSLLREMGPTDAQLRRVEGWITDAIRKRHQERQANSKTPRGMALTMHLADLYDLRGKYDEAEKLYKAVLREEPGNVVALNNLAWLLAQRQQNGAEAKPLIETAVQVVGRQPHLLDTRGLVHLALGQNEAAVSDFQEAVKDSPNPTRLFHLARAYHRAGDKDTAARVLREAAQLGLRPEKLHPIEQGACTSLLNELKVKIDRPAERGT